MGPWRSLKAMQDTLINVARTEVRMPPKQGSLEAVQLRCGVHAVLPQCTVVQPLQPVLPGELVAVSPVEASLDLM